VPKFELYKHNDEIFTIYYGIFILDTGRHWRTQFWKGTTQGSFQQSLVEIGTVVSEEKIFTVPISTKLCWNDLWVVPFQNCVRQRRPVSKMAAMPSWIQDGAEGHNFERGPPKDHFSKVWLRLAQ
jgi:hypothetical protein